MIVNMILQWITLDSVSVTLLQIVLATHDSRVIGEGGSFRDTMGTVAVATATVAMERERRASLWFVGYGVTPRD